MQPPYESTIWWKPVKEINSTDYLPLETVDKCVTGSQEKADCFNPVFCQLEEGGGGGGPVTNGEMQRPLPE